MDFTLSSVTSQLPLVSFRPFAKVLRLAGNDQNEAIQVLVRERKLSLVERLRDTAWEEVMDMALDLGQMQIREQMPQPALPPVDATDPYDIAWNLVENWKGALQQLGQMPRLTDLKENDEYDDYHDELSRLYRQVCRDLSLPWPPPARKE